MKKILILLAFAVLLFFVSRGIMAGTRFMRETGLTPTLLFKLVFDGGATLKASSGRTNMLLLGVGGGTHDGADLTDTMMVLSIDAMDKSMAMISVPRDIWSDTLKDKVNSAYHYGEEKQPGGGLVPAKAIVEDVIGIPVHYAFVIDFSGFKNIIDTVGGVDVLVEREFTDTKYPIPGKEQDSCPGDPTNACVYETVHFDASSQHMDGARALVYARSRHAEGVEGSDFARSKRQQDIMVALKNKMVDVSSWVTLERLQLLPKVIDDATDMDMNIGEVVTIGKRFVGVKQDQIKKISFEELLYEPPTYLYGRYVLAPVEDWQTVHEYIKQQLQ